MKKILLLFCFSIAILATTTHQSMAQNAFEKGKVIGNAGIQLQSGITPVIIGAEYGATDEIGVGGRVYYASSGGVSSFFVGVQGNYHFAKIFNVTGDKLDPYAGFTLGKSFYSGSGRTASGNVALLAQIGTRYFVNDKIGPYAQINIGVANAGGSSFELGVAYKFGQ